MSKLWDILKNAVIVSQPERNINISVRGRHSENERRREVKPPTLAEVHFLEVVSNSWQTQRTCFLLKVGLFNHQRRDNIVFVRSTVTRKLKPKGSWQRLTGEGQPRPPCVGVCLLHESAGRMSLSSGGWAHSPGYTPDHSAALPGHYGASQSQLGSQTVLMSVRVSVCHSGIRPLCLPGAGDESLRLQLSMDPGKSGEFRLSLQDSNGTGRSVVSSRAARQRRCRAGCDEWRLFCVCDGSVNRVKRLCLWEYGEIKLLIRLI